MSNYDLQLLQAQRGFLRYDMDEIAARFKEANLPVTLPEGLTFEGLKPLMKGDKKREGNTVVFALPCGWGDVRGVRQ